MANENKEYNQSVARPADYAITITFKHLHTKSPKGMFKETAPYLTKLLSRSTTFSLVIEFRHETGDAHYHGVIQITDYIKWHRDTLPSLKRLGFVCIKVIGCSLYKRRYTDMFKGWEKYYTKEIDIARGLLGDYFPLTKVIEFKPKDLKTNNIMEDYILNDCAKEDYEEGTKSIEEESK